MPSRFWPTSPTARLPVRRVRRRSRGRPVPDRVVLPRCRHRPSVQAQAAIYAEVLEAFAGQKVVIRTLDAGSDKPLKFVNSPEERTRPGRARIPDHRDRRRSGGPSTRRDRRGGRADRKRTVGDGADDRHAGGGPSLRRPGPGTQPAPRRHDQVPAAALLAAKILEHVEFLSIGTNDLTQYTMAADRMSSDLATLTDPWQPGVLALVAKPPAPGGPPASRSVCAVKRPPIPCSRAC